MSIYIAHRRKNNASNATLSGLSYTYWKIEAKGLVERRQGRGTECTISIRENIKSVLRTGSQPRKSACTDRSVREIARETDRDNRSHQISVSSDIQH